MSQEPKEVKVNETHPERGYARVSLPIKTIMRNNFFGGLAWGFGTVIGATIVVALVFWTLSRLNSVPFLGDIIDKIVKQVQTTPRIQ